MERKCDLKTLDTAPNNDKITDVSVIVRGQKPLFKALWFSCWNVCVFSTVPQNMLNCNHNESFLKAEKIWRGHTRTHRNTNTQLLSVKRSQLEKKALGLKKWWHAHIHTRARTYTRKVAETLLLPFISKDSCWAVRTGYCGWGRLLHRI